MDRQGTGGQSVLSRWHLLPVISTSPHCLLLLDLSWKIQLVKHWLEHGLALLTWLRAQSALVVGIGPPWSGVSSQQPTRTTGLHTSLYATAGPRSLIPGNEYSSGVGQVPYDTYA